MTFLASSPRPRRQDSPVLVPRVPDFEFPGLAATWPPTAAVAFALTQSWLPQPEPTFRPGTAWLAATEDALVVRAELHGGQPATRAMRDNERLWEEGDVFEIFLQPFGGEAYFEFQIAPNERQLRLHYPWIGVPRHEGLEPYLRRDGLLQSAIRLCPATDTWRVTARIPIAPLLPTRPRLAGTDWRVAFCRYDYGGTEKFCLSSSAQLTRPDFHRIGEWSRVTICG